MPPACLFLRAPLLDSLEELLALAGFPRGFGFPPEVPLKKQLSSIGNSVSVTVVKHVMNALFSGAGAT